MISNWEELKALGLAMTLPRVELSTSWGNENLKAHGKLWTWWSPYVDAALFKGSIEEREMLMAADPDTFILHPHYAKHGLLLVAAGHIDEGWAEARLRQTWRDMAPKRFLRNGMRSMSDAMVEVKSRAELRDWLDANHATSAPVWLVVYKKHTDHYLPWGEAISELLCWGWVDSVTRKVDADRSGYRIAPRNPRSAWSAVNKAKVAEARATGLMQPAGEAVIARAMANGMWEFLDDVEAGILPDDLVQALEENGARSGWEDYPRSVTRGALEWIKTAKTPATRSKRIDDVASSAAKGLRPSPFRRD